MKRARLLLIIMILLISGCATQVKIRRPGTFSWRETTPVVIASPAKEFPEHEVLNYEVSWMGFSVGAVKLTIDEVTDYEGHEVYIIKTAGRGNKFLSRFLKVEDCFTSYLDTATFLPRRFERKTQHGLKRRERFVEFDREQGKATYHEDGKIKVFDLAEDAQDIVSGLYYFRLQEVTSGQEIVFNVHTDEKNYLVEAEVDGVSRINLSGFGEIDAFLIEPKAKFEGVFIRRGRAWLWFSADSRRIPLYIRAATPFGSVTAALTSIE